MIPSIVQSQQNLNALKAKFSGKKKQIAKGARNKLKNKNVDTVTPGMQIQADILQEQLYQAQMQQAQLRAKQPEAPTVAEILAANRAQTADSQLYGLKKILMQISQKEIPAPGMLEQIQDAPESIQRVDIKTLAKLEEMYHGYRIPGTRGNPAAEYEAFMAQQYARNEWQGLPAPPQPMGIKPELAKNEVIQQLMKRK